MHKDTRFHVNYRLFSDKCIIDRVLSCVSSNDVYGFLHTARPRLRHLAANFIAGKGEALLYFLLSPLSF